MLAVMCGVLRSQVEQIFYSYAVNAVYFNCNFQQCIVAFILSPCGIERSSQSKSRKIKGMMDVTKTNVIQT